MELDEIAGWIVEEGLAPRAHRGGIRHRHPRRPELGNDTLEVLDEEGEVLPAARRWLGANEVQLLRAGVQPRALYAQLAPVRPRRRPARRRARGPGPV